MIIKFKIWLFLAALMTVNASCHNKGKGDYKCPDCNIILISIDTLRSDHLGCYEYKRNTSPVIDSFSKDAVIFKQAIAQAPSTEPSHASIFTSLIPSHHKALFSLKQALPKDATTMAEILSAHGYGTAAFTGGGQVDENFGMAQGFDIYYSYKSKNIINEKFRDKIRKAIKWIGDNKPKKYFIFLHTFEVHQPYRPADKYMKLFESHYKGLFASDNVVELSFDMQNGKKALEREDRDHVIAAYDASIKSVDDSFATLIEYLKKNRLYNKTIIVFTSDHGEEFGEHGWMAYHSHTLYDELIKVPLIIKFARSAFKSKILSQQVRSIDILPTVLDAVGIPPDDVFEGASLLPLITGKENKGRIAVSQRDTVHPTLLSSIRTEKWKLYKNKLYDLAEDPMEQSPVSKPEIANKLGSEMWKIVEGGKANFNPEKAKIEEVQSQQLKALGYYD